MHETFIALGSNLGDRLATLRHAAHALQTLGSVRASSRVWETRAMYLEDQPPFLNAAVALVTPLAPLALLDELLRIERSLGRVRTVRNGPRTIDLDLIAHGDTTLCSERLTLPHPRLHERAFVLCPLAEIAPDWHPPTCNRSVRVLLDALDDPSPPLPRSEWLPVSPQASRSPLS
jgi:2-amino-4-hydroxy-6-hydroxymethyldihydropteridine diphosphokinase